MTETIPDLMADIRNRLEALETSLVRRIEAQSVSPRAKLPFHVIQCREALAWRSADLAREAFDAIQQQRFTVAALLVRAVVETVGAEWYLRTQVIKAIESGSSSEVKTSLTRLLLGSRTSPEMPDAINVLTFIDAADKEVKGLRIQFDRLCEFAHPNWAGTSLLYSMPNAEAEAVEFGRNMREGDSVHAAAVVNLSVALLMFETAYNGIADLQGRFVDLCDGELSDAV